MTEYEAMLAQRRAARRAAKQEERQETGKRFDPTPERIALANKRIERLRKKIETLRANTNPAIDLKSRKAIASSKLAIRRWELVIEGRKP